MRVDWLHEYSTSNSGEICAFRDVLKELMRRVMWCKGQAHGRVKDRKRTRSSEESLVCGSRKRRLSEVDRSVREGSAQLKARGKAGRRLFDTQAAGKGHVRAEGRQGLNCGYTCNGDY